MGWEHYVLYDPKTKHEREIRFCEEQGWQLNWRHGDNPVWEKLNDVLAQQVDRHLKNYGYKMPLPIKTEEQYRFYLDRAWLLMDAMPGSIEAHELGRLVDVIEAYEDKHYPIPEPTSEALIEFRKDQEKLL